MSIDYIRSTYDVPAKLGGRVEYTGNGKPQLGTIRGTEGAHLLIKIDGFAQLLPYHPTWKLRYLEGDAQLPQESDSE